jgi:hypothetical protein
MFTEQNSISRIDGASRDIKHLRIMMGLRELSAAIERLNVLDQQIRAGDMETEKQLCEAVPQPNLSLADFLNETPKVISSMLETLDNIESSLRDQLF